MMLGEGTQGEESSSPAEGSKFLLGDRNSSKYKDEAGGCTRTWRGSEGGGAFQGEATAAPCFLICKKGVITIDMDSENLFLYLAICTRSVQKGSSHVT